MQLVQTDNLSQPALKNVYRPPSYFCERPPVAPIIVFPFEIPTTPMPTPPISLEYLPR